MLTSISWKHRVSQHMLKNIKKCSDHFVSCINSAENIILCQLNFILYVRYRALISREKNVHSTTEIGEDYRFKYLASALGSGLQTKVVRHKSTMCCPTYASSQEIIQGEYAQIYQIYHSISGIYCL